MALTKDDVQAIGRVIEERVRPIVKEEVSGVETRLKTEITDLRAEMRQLFKAQAQQVTKAITDALKLIAESYTTKEKLEELENEIDALRSEVEQLKRQIAAA